jgi:hypothetical protein
MIKENKIQTLHPQIDKTGKKITIEKYEAIKETMLSVLSDTELTHTELMETMYDKLKDSFQGNVQWYGETVKLDLEARKIIERTKSKPQKYKLTSS